MQVITKYTIRFAQRTEDLMAAAAACNKALNDVGETFSREAAEDQIFSCRESLRSGLWIEAKEFEVWEAWLDGARSEAETFLVPVGGVHDVAAMGASALGVDVSQELNVARA